MSGSLAIPNQFANVAPPGEPASLLDDNLVAIANYINARENSTGTLAARPGAGIAGRFYTATDQGNTLYFDNGSAWIQLSASTVPTGTMFDFAGFVAPAGFLLCDAATYSRITQVALFNAITLQTTGDTHSSTLIDGMGSTTNMDVGMPISGPGIPAGTTVSSVDSGTQIHISQAATATANGVALVVAPYGVGDGTTTFNVPDYRGRASFGAGTGSGLTKRILGIKSGEEAHALTAAENGTHSHAALATAGLAGFAGGGNTFTIGGTDLGQVTGNSGSGTAHNTMPPYLIANKVIKT